MADQRKPIPKRQSQISQNAIETYSVENYNDAQKQDTPDVINANRGSRRSVKGDNVKQFSIGIKDIDETILYYFNNVIKPSVIRNGNRIPVPIIYGSPERWKAVQKDGYYRDKNGKIQTPLIMFKRESIEKNRNIGNKLDANNPNNFGIFKKSYSKRNVYDHFALQVNKAPVEEFYGVIIPDYVNIRYSCIIFTDYSAQMNKIIESINYASDSYWGDPERFGFRAMIDTYATSIEVQQGQDRAIKTTFEINLLGHIVSDSINTSIANMNKFYSKATIKFGIDVAGTQEMLEDLANTTEKQLVPNFYENIPSSTTINQTYTSGLTAEQIDYLSLNTMIDTNTNGFSLDTVGNAITFTNVTIATPPTGFPALTAEDFFVFINGQAVEPSAIDSISQVGADVLVQFNGTLNFALEVGMEITLVGKLIV